MVGKEKKIDTEEFKKLVWDYTLTSEDFLSILSGKKEMGWFTQKWAIARVLENLDYYRAIDLIGFITLSQHWDQVKKSIRDPALKRGYEYALRAKAVSSAKFHRGYCMDNLTFGFSEGILANKLSALLGRDDPKDVVDIWIIASQKVVDWRSMFTDISSRAKGVFPPLVAEKIATFPIELLETIKWVAGKQPAPGKVQDDLAAITDAILQTDDV